MDRFANAHFLGPFDHKEHFFIDTMIVKREGALARRHAGEVVAGLLRTQERRDKPHTRVKSLGCSARGGEGGGAGL